MLFFVIFSALLCFEACAGVGNLCLHTTKVGYINIYTHEFPLNICTRCLYVSIILVNLVLRPLFECYVLGARLIIQQASPTCRHLYFNILNIYISLACCRLSTLNSKFIAPLLWQFKAIKGTIILSLTSLFVAILAN